MASSSAQTYLRRWIEARTRQLLVLGRKRMGLGERPAGVEVADKYAARWLAKAYQDCVPYVPPIRLDVSLTEACNTRCAYCWQQKKRAGRLTFDHVAGLLDAMCSLKPPDLTLTGGEPTIWPDLERLLAHAKDSGAQKIRLCTNGYRLRHRDYAERLVALGVTDLCVSVDTFEPGKFERLRGYRFSDFEQVLSNCISIKNRHPRMRISLASVVCKAVTWQELQEVENYCKRYGFDHFLQSFETTGYDCVDEEFGVTPKEREKLTGNLAWLDDQAGKVVRRRVNPLTEGEQRVNCYKGITTVKLSSDGAVRFCWMSRPIGNIAHDSFVDIWTSERAKRMRRYIRDKKCRCTFDCDIYESLDLYQSV